jgi:predicted ATPase
MIKRISFKGFKSLASGFVEPGPVTLLIGQNAAGKSNVVDALRILAEAVAGDMETAVSRRGGIEAVVSRGMRADRFAIELDYFVPDPAAPASRSDMRYRVEVGDGIDKAAVLLEELRVKRTRNEPGKMKVWFSAKRGKGQAVDDPGKGSQTEFDTGDPGVLVLKALGFLSTYPRIRALRTFIESWQFLQVNLGAIRSLHRDERSAALAPDASNLVNVLRTLSNGGRRAVLADIVADLKNLLAFVNGVDTTVDRGLVQLLLKERYFDVDIDPLSTSDGTLRLLALVTALHLMPEHGLLVVEEPEHGLHPLVFGPLLDLMRERCPKGVGRQVLVTTHSPDLLDAAETEEVVVVDRNEAGVTELKRLDPVNLAEWRSDFRLGELWRMRQIGGVPR